MSFINPVTDLHLATEDLMDKKVISPEEKEELKRALSSTKTFDDFAPFWCDFIDNIESKLNISNLSPLEKHFIKNHLANLHDNSLLNYNEHTELYNMNNLPEKVKAKLEDKDESTDKLIATYTHLNSEEIAKIKNSFPSVFDIDNWTKMQKLQKEILTVIDMIDSCLIYDTDFFEVKKRWDGTYSYAEKYESKNLSKAQIKNLHDERKDYFKNHVKIKRNTYTDSEGVTYNSIIEY